MHPAEPLSSDSSAREAPSGLPTQQEAEVMLTAAVGQIRWARQYTLELLAATPKELWHELPPPAEAQSSGVTGGGVTSVAWQVGHLAVSQYGLLMFRIHGRRDDDLDLIPGRFRKAFSRGSDPSAVTAGRWPADELLERLDHVHERSLAGLSENLDAAVLLEPVEMPYAVYPIKLGAILFCPLHEHIHAGQIGLVRRGLGLPPIR